MNWNLNIDDLIMRWQPWEWARTKPHGHIVICNGDHNISVLDQKCNCWSVLAWWVMDLDV